MNCQLPISNCRLNCRLSNVDYRLKSFLESEKSQGLGHSAFRIPHSALAPRPAFRIPHSPFLIRHSAFTIMEMVIVVAIIVVLVTLVIPNVSALWNQRKLADAENTISGLLTSTRAKALQSGHDRCLLFFVDDQNVQRVVTIVQDPAKASDPSGSGLKWQNIFVVSDERGYSIPSPMRAVPRSVIYREEDEGDMTTYSTLEIANTDFARPATADSIHRHRNFFSICYAGDGRLLVGRDVLLLEKDDDGNRIGDITGLAVGEPSEVKDYHAVEGQGSSAQAVKKQIDPLGGTSMKDGEYVVSDAIAGNVAINFPSVDGLLIYDDSLLAGIETPDDKRKYLLDYGQPFYIHRMTGAVVRGPVAENVAVTP